MNTNRFNKKLKAEDKHILYTVYVYIFPSYSPIYVYGNLVARHNITLFEKKKKKLLLYAAGF